MIKMKYYSYFCIIALLINAGCLRQEEASIKTDLEEVELDIIKHFLVLIIFLKKSFHIHI